MRSRPSSWCRQFLLVAHHLFVRRPSAIAQTRAGSGSSSGRVPVGAQGSIVSMNARGSQHVTRTLIYAGSPARLRRRSASALVEWAVSMLIITFQADLGTMRGHGPFAGPNPG